jgi:hypothetical protein
MLKVTDVPKQKFSKSTAPWAVLMLFVVSALGQIVIPIVHAREVDAKEYADRSCEGHPKSHVERDLGPSHHDSSSCPVCQLVYSVQPADIQLGDGVELFAHTSEAFISLGTAVLIPSTPLTASAPRAPPSLP